MKGKYMKTASDLYKELIEQLQSDVTKWADRAMIAEKYIPTSRFAEYRKEAYGRKD
jgi:hypothetical protein